MRKMRRLGLIPQSAPADPSQMMRMGQISAVPRGSALDALKAAPPARLHDRFKRRVKRADHIARDFGGQLDVSNIVRACAFRGPARPGIARPRARLVQGLSVEFS